VPPCLSSTRTPLFHYLSVCSLQIIAVKIASYVFAWRSIEQRVIGASTDTLCDVTTQNVQKQAGDGYLNRLCKLICIYM